MKKTLGREICASPSVFLIKSQILRLIHMHKIYRRSGRK